MVLFGELFIEKKFTQEEEELIDEFVLKATHELDKAGFKVMFKPDRNTKPKPTSDYYSVTDIAKYELFHQGKRINADVSYVGLDVTFLKTLHWRPFTKNFQELFIRFYGMVESAYTRGIKIENNSYSTEPKEYFDYTQKDLVKKTIILIKHWSKKEKVKN